MKQPSRDFIPLNYSGSRAVGNPDIDPQTAILGRVVDKLPSRDREESVFDIQTDELGVRARTDYGSQQRSLPSAECYGQFDNENDHNHQLENEHSRFIELVDHGFV